MALCESQIRSKNITVLFDIAPGLNVFCRPVQISQVLLNVLGNATYELGYVSDREKILRIRAYQVDAEVIVDIIDNGRGIPTGLIDKIMQPFFTTKPVGEGTGLGLSISLGIMATHKGRILVHSEPGNTCFKIQLPIASQKAEAMHYNASSRTQAEARM
jgi:signal transduction histidine kinase